MTPMTHTTNADVSIYYEAIDRSFSPLGVAHQFCALTASGSRSRALRTVQVPTLVLHGDHDHLIDISGGERTAQCIPGARFVVIEGKGSPSQCRSPK